MSGPAPDLALFVPSLRPGGAERVMLTLAQGFAGQGLRVELVAARAEGAFLAEAKASVPVIDLGARRVAAALPALVAYLRRQRPRALLSALDHANLVALLARRLANAPTRVAVSTHGLPRTAAARSPLRRQRWLLPLMRRAYARADGVVAVSQGVAAELAEAAGLAHERISVINNPFNIKRLRQRAEAPLDHPWFGEGAPPVVLAVGRLTAAKDYPTLLRAYDNLRRERPVRLMILGEGDERAGLEALAKGLGLGDDFALPGFVAEPLPFMRRSGVLAVASAWEGFGNVVVEALAAGLPVVATAGSGGPEEILDHGRFGRLVPIGDHVALAAALKAMLDDPPGPALLAGRAEAFDIAPTLARYADVLGLTP